MNDTLVIHPEDETTNMLKLVYENKGFDVINNPDVSSEELRNQIQSHKRIIILGHGDKHGLANPGFIHDYRHHFNKPFLLDDSFADLLKDKEVISVWCYSDQYFKRNNIKGFHTGMIISEVLEEEFILGHRYLSEKEVTENITYFCKLVGDCINSSPNEMKKYLLDNYIGDDPVTQFNRKNIIVL